MQGNATEIDERNLLQLDALLSHGYGLSPQLVMRSKGLSIEAKALYGYLSSFAGAGDTAFPSTSRILEELDISKNRFYKIRKELVSWGFISIETTATSAGLRTVYTLPQNPIAIKTEIDEIANRRNEIKSSLVANLHNEDMVSHKGDSESERLQQSAGNKPCRQSEAKAQNRGSNLKPCLQSEDEGCLQSGDKLYIDTNINPKVSIDRSATRPSDDEGPSDWKVIEGMTDSTQRDDGESDRDANRRDALDAVPDGTYDSLPTVADGYTLSNSEFEAFNRLCSLSIKTVRGAVRNEAAKQYANAQPFCVATDYDRATASWSYGKYFSDLGCAHEAADPEIIADASVRWVKEDIREKLKAQDIAPTEFNVQSVIMGDSRLWERPLDREFRDNMIASGNDDLDARVTILKENGNFKNVDTAIPVTSLEELEQYRSDRLTDKVTSLKDSLDAQYKADERGRVFDRPCQVLDDGDLDEH